MTGDLDRRCVLAKGRLLIKRVAAAAGDHVCRRGTGVSINAQPVAKARYADLHGTPIPSWQGYNALDDGQVFIL